MNTHQNLCGTLKITNVFSNFGEVNLKAVGYMPDEEVLILGGWNSKILQFLDMRQENYFEKIMEVRTPNTFNLSSVKYVEALKLLLVGDCFSELSVFRWSLLVLQILKSTQSQCFSRNGREFIIGSVSKCLKFLNLRIDSLHSLFMNGKQF